jgi:hypothetical protein
MRAQTDAPRMDDIEMTPLSIMPHLHRALAYLERNSDD